MNPLHRLGPTARGAWTNLIRPEVWQRAATVAVHIILTLALARALAALTVAVLWGQVVPVGMPPPGSAAGRTAGVQPGAEVTIAGWRLFGAVETSQPVPAAPSAIPVTPLNLRLVGVFLIEPGQDRALALIADGSGIERGYRVGDQLPGGARLEQIQRHQVLVSRNGRQEAINLPKPDETGQTVLPTPSTPLAPESSSGSATVIDASAIVGRLRGEIAARPQALEDIAFASPYLQNGQFVGFRLRPGRDRQLFQQLGLNGGDVLTEINGTRLNNPAQGLMLLQELISAARIDVRVLRNGAEVPLTFSLDGSAPAGVD